MNNVVDEIIGDHKAVKYQTELYVEKQDNGWWHAIQTISQEVTDDLEEWEEKVVKFEAKDSKLEKAIAEAAILATFYLESINYDLFSAELDLEEGAYLQ
jgi:hypothetical protein